MAIEGGGDYRQRLVQRQLQIKKRKKAGLANARADAGPPSSSRTFSSPPKSGKASLNRFSTQGVSSRDDKIITYGGKAMAFAAPNIPAIIRGITDPVGTAKGVAEISSYTNPATLIQRGVNAYRGEGFTKPLMGADAEDIEQAVEIAGIIPYGKAAKAVKAVPSGIKFAEGFIPELLSASQRSYATAEGPVRSGIAAGKAKLSVSPEEVLETARSYADEAAKLSAFSVSDLRKIAKDATDQATVSFEQARALGKDVKMPTGENIKKIQVPVSEQFRSWLNVAAAFDPEKIPAITIMPKDVPFDIRLLQRALAVGEGARLDLPMSIPTKDIGLQIIGETVEGSMSKANRMFKSGVEASYAIAHAIDPTFVGRFRTQPLKRDVAEGLLGLFTEARGGIKPVTGTVFSGKTGEKIESATREIQNANDHAIAKAAEAAKQAVEQRVAKALGIELPEDFLAVRQAQLDFVNNPNLNDVIVDFIANSGKGGVSLPALSAFLSKRLQSGKLRPHQRAAYEQMLGDALSGKYNEINAMFTAISREVDNPLDAVIDPKAMEYLTDRIDQLRRKIRAVNAPEYDNATFMADMERLGGVMDSAAKVASQRGQRITKELIKELF